MDKAQNLLRCWNRPLLLGVLVSSLLALWPATSQAQFFPIGRLLGIKISLTGRDLNGTALNGDVLDGRYVTGVSLDHVAIKNDTVKARLRKTKFRGRAEDKLFGKVYTAKKFVGAVFQAQLDDGSTISLRIDAMDRAPEWENKDVFIYQVSYLTASSWQPLCGVDDQGEPVGAVPLQGRWNFEQGTPQGGSWIDDPRSFTFGCQGYVLAKCVFAGYKPWKKALFCAEGEGCHQESLATYHQACTRMLRADFCGDGTPHTADGTMVNAYDALGIRYDDDPWLVEAEWDAAGARCAVRQRIAGDLPWCMNELEDPGCGAVQRFSQDTLIISEVQP